jgi:hypothetical protein
VTKNTLEIFQKKGDYNIPFYRNIKKEEVVFYGGT